MSTDDGWPVYVQHGPRRWPWVVAGTAVLVVGLVVGVVIGARALGGGDPGSDGARGTVQPSPSSTPDATPSTTPSRTPSATPSPTPGGPDADVRCWDGDLVGAVRDCSQPDGREGLEYVFPSIADQACRELSAGARDGRVLTVRCRADLEDGTTVRLDYVQWTSVDAAVGYFDEQPGLERGDLPEGYLWNGRDGDDYTAVGLYLDEPFSSAATAPTEDALAATLESQVAGRPADEVRGRPIG